MRGLRLRGSAGGDDCRDLSRELDEGVGARTIVILLGVVDRQTPAGASRHRDCGRDERGQLFHGQSSRFVRNSRQALCREHNGVENIDIDVQPPCLTLFGHVERRSAGSV